MMLHVALNIKHLTKYHSLQRYHTLFHSQYSVTFAYTFPYVNCEKRKNEHTSEYGKNVDVTW